MTIDASALLVARKLMSKRPLHCTRTDEEDGQGGRLETTSMMWYQPPRSKKSAWAQVTSTEFRYFRNPSKQHKRLESWHVTTLHIEYAESAEIAPTVVVHTSRHHYPTMVFDNYESRMVGRARSAHWSQKLSMLTRQIQDLCSYAHKRRERNYYRALMSAFETERLLEQGGQEEVAS